jgi:thioredoxin 1
MASDKVKVFNDLNFEDEVLKAEGPVMVDFTATWCAPCKRLAPIVEELDTELDGKVTVGKLDVDEAPMTAQKYGVRSVPTILLFKNGEQAAQHIGLATKAKLLGLVQ